MISKMDEKFFKDLKGMSNKMLIELNIKSLKKYLNSNGQKFQMSIPAQIDDTDILWSELIKRFNNLIKNESKN